MIKLLILKNELCLCKLIFIVYVLKRNEMKNDIFCYFYNKIAKKRLQKLKETSKIKRKIFLKNGGSDPYFSRDPGKQK